MKKKAIAYKPEDTEQRIKRKVDYYYKLTMQDGVCRVLRLLLTVIEELKAGKCSYPRCPDERR